jgi:hypothetical protein
MFNVQEINLWLEILKGVKEYLSIYKRRRRRRRGREGRRGRRGRRRRNY